MEDNWRSTTRNKSLCTDLPRGGTANMEFFKKTKQARVGARKQNLKTITRLIKGDGVLDTLDATVLSSLFDSGIYVTPFLVAKNLNLHSRR